MKRCRKCQVWKPETAFNHHPKNKDGLQSYCKVCIERCWRKAATRKALKQHEADFQHDPERLTTSFLEAIIGIGGESE